METILENQRKVAFIGMGEMALRMALRLEESSDYFVTEVRRGDDLAEKLKDQDITVVTMRPQQWDEVNARTGERASEEIAQHVNRQGIFTYIMAATGIDKVRDDLGVGQEEKIALVRAMPTAAVDGYSETALYAEKDTLTVDQKARIEAFYGQFGRVTWLESEDMFPAYTFYVASMIALLAGYLETHRLGAVEVGFGEKQSEQMLTGALKAAAHLADQGYSLVEIFGMVKTKGGITEAAAEAAQRRNRQRRLTRAMAKAAFKRSRELVKR